MRKVYIKSGTQNKSGFTLIESVVVLAILSVVALGSVTVFNEHREHSKWQESEIKLKSIKKALVGFANVNKYLLCPDTNANPDGLENRNPNGTCVADTGGVPYENLNLSLGTVSDSWGNPVIYAVNQNTLNVADINNSPQNSACFFNNTQPPRFDLTTLPLPAQNLIVNLNGGIGVANAGNLRVCNVVNCGIAGPLNIDAEAAIAVLISQNSNGDTGPPLGAGEAENMDLDNFFVQLPYSTAPFFDDQILSISANELKESSGSTATQQSRDANFSPPDPNNPFGNLVLPIAGGSGDNNRFATNIGINIESGTINFGQQNAGQTVTFSFNAVVRGGWEDADALNEGVAAQTSWNGQLETQDQFVVGLNSNVDSNLYAIAQENGLVDLDQGLEWFGVDKASNPDQYHYYDENDDADNTWYEYKSYDVELDQNGDLRVDFAVFSTHVSERVEVSNVEAELYSAPKYTPSMPEVVIDTKSESNVAVLRASQLLTAMNDGDVYLFPGAEEFVHTATPTPTPIVVDVP